MNAFGQLFPKTFNARSFAGYAEFAGGIKAAFDGSQVWRWRSDDGDDDHDDEVHNDEHPSLRHHPFVVSQLDSSIKGRDVQCV